MFTFIQKGEVTLSDHVFIFHVIVKNSGFSNDLGIAAGSGSWQGEVADGKTEPELIQFRIKKELWRNGVPND